MGNLRKRTIRLAHENPELRPHLLPLLKQHKTGAALDAIKSLHAASDHLEQAVKTLRGMPGIADFQPKERLEVTDIRKEIVKLHRRIEKLSGIIIYYPD